MPMVNGGMVPTCSYRGKKVAFPYTPRQARKISKWLPEAKPLRITKIVPKSPYFRHPIPFWHFSANACPQSLRLLQQQQQQQTPVSCQKLWVRSAPSSTHLHSTPASKYATGGTNFSSLSSGNSSTTVSTLGQPSSIRNNTTLITPLAATSSHGSEMCTPSMVI